MTAIAGCVGDAGQNRSEICAGMLRALRDYGLPDEAIGCREGATFGRSLIKTLPEDCFDQQPLWDGVRFLLVADIRLDNRRELAAAIGIPAAELSSLSDSHILLRAWTRWHARALEHLVGDFAFAIFDQVERSLTLVRDPTGQRPLFFAQHAGLSAFASMPSGLRNWLPGKLRFDVLAGKLQGAPDEGEATCFEGIFRVLPAHVAVLTPTSQNQRRYWSPSTEPLNVRPQDYAEAYRDILDDAVAACLRRRGGPIAAQLSSGYDSSAVASSAATLEGASQLIAFTSAPRLGFDGPVPRGRMADESAVAAQTAAMHGMRHYVVRPTTGILAPLRQHARLYQQPDRNIINVEWWNAILGRAREQGASIILTGQLGNLTLNAGGLPVLAEWIRSGQLWRWFREAHAARGRSGVRWRGVLINSFEEWLPDWVIVPIEHLLGPAPIVAESFTHPHWSRLRAQSMPEVPPGPYRLRRAALATQDLGIFRKGSLAGFGVEERDPLANRRLIDFSFRLPPHQLFHNGVSRPLVRAALAERLPAAVLHPKLRGYQGADWYERFDKIEAQQLIEEIAPSCGVNELIDLNKIRRSIDHWPDSGWADPKIHGFYRTRLLGAISTGVFIKEFETPRPSPCSGTSAREKHPALPR